QCLSIKSLNRHYIKYDRATAEPSKRPPSEHLSAVLSMYSVTHRFSRRFFSITGETGAVLRPGESHVRRQGTGDRLPEDDARAARGGSDRADGGTRHGAAPNAGRHQTRRGRLDGRQGILRRPSIREGGAGREARGVDRDRAR